MVSLEENKFPYVSPLDLDEGGATRDFGMQLL